MTRMRRATGEALLAPPRNRRSKEKPYNRYNGKSVEGREGDGWVGSSDEAELTSVERSDPAVCAGSNNKEGKGEMTKTPISLHDLRRSLYVKAKAEPTWRFWGLYVHVCKMETLREAYQMAKSNDGAPGIDGVTFEAIEESGVESFVKQLRDELVSNTYRPMRARKKEVSQGRAQESPRPVDSCYP